MSFDFKVFERVISEPAKTFKEQEKNASLGKAILYVGIAGFNSSYNACNKETIR